MKTPPPGTQRKGTAPDEQGAAEAPEGRLKLFVYCLMMGPEGLRDALGDRKTGTLRLRPARLTGWRRIWNVYHPDWNGATLNVEPKPEDSVVGVLIEGLSEEDFAVLDRREASLLPRETIYVQPMDGDPVSAQLYRRRKGNHEGRPSTQYRSMVQQRAYRAGFEVYQSLCRDTVDAEGQPLTFG
jgi:hypothetical protein